MLCPRCDFENTETSTYCIQCGTPLPISTPYSHLQRENSLPPTLPMEYSTSPSTNYGLQSEMFQHQKISEPRSRITVLRVIRGILYFMAAFIAAFGVVGTFNALFGTSNLFEGLAIFFGFGLLVGSVVIFLFMRHRAPRLRWAQFIWSSLAATAGMVMAFILAFALTANGPFSELSFWIIVLLYGFVLAAICLW